MDTNIKPNSANAAISLNAGDKIRAPRPPRRPSAQVREVDALQGDAVEPGASTSRLRRLKEAALVAPLVLLAVLAVRLVSWDRLDPAATGDIWWWALAATGLVLAILVVALIVATWKSLREPEGFGASLLAQSPIMVGLATALTVGFYILPDSQYPWLPPWGTHAALGAGILVALAFGVGVAFIRRDLTAPDVVNPRVYGELKALFDDLDVRLASYCPHPPEGASIAVATDACDPEIRLSRATACEVARRHHDLVAEELGLCGNPKTCGTRWLLGTGYIHIWHRLHEADEALFIVKPDVDVAGDGLYDEMRLKGSHIDNSVDYIDRLRWALGHFKGGDGYLMKHPGNTVVKDREITPRSRAQARVALREVRHVINQYRDARRDGLVRTRINLMVAGTLTGLIASLLLAMAVLQGVKESTIVAALTFYLVGATVGLVDQMNRGWDDTWATEEDYGLTQARLLFTPLQSGLAALGGVLITTMLYATLSDPFATTSGTGADQAANQTVPHLSAILDLERGRFGIVIAAVFGLTPRLFVDRLKGQAEKYKADLQSSNAQGNR